MQDAQASGGRIKAWVAEKPWHLWVLIAIGLVGLYIAWKTYQAYVNNSGSTGGIFAGLSGPATNTPSSVSGGTTTTTASSTAATSPWQGYLSFLGANPAQPTADPHFFDVGESQAPQLNTIQELANFFNLKGGTQDILLNPHNANLVKQGVGPNTPLQSGTEVWITTSTFQTQ